MNRRTFIRSSAALGLLARLETLTPAWARRLAGPVRLQPGLAPTRRTPGLVEYDLEIAETPFFVNGRRGTATTIGGTVPGPLLRFTEGDEAVIRITNRLDHDTSVHWHGILVPNPMDGVPGVNFPGIRAGETFEYRFPIKQYGTYWYHSHSAFQEQTGLYGPLVIDPEGGEPYGFDREYFVVLSDWTFEDPHRVLAKLKKQGNFFNRQRQTLAGLFRGEDMGFNQRLAWSRMRMDPTDISDITGTTYTYLMNGQAPDANWTAPFNPGERVLFRFINAAAGTFFDVRFPGLPMTLVQASGQHVEPVVVDEFRIGIAETYDVVVEPEGSQAYTIFAESMDRSGYARGTLAPQTGMEAAIPPRRERPLLTMADMGMAHDMEDMDAMDHGEMDHGGMDHGEMNGDAPADTTGALQDHDMNGHDMGDHEMHGRDRPGDGAAPGAEGAPLRPPGTLPEPTPHGPDSHGPGNAMTPETTRSRLHEPGIGLDPDERRVLVYTDLRALHAEPRRAPDREIELHLTGNMERFMWSINGKTYSEDPIVPVTYGERIRLTMINDTMMNHPMHLHGMWMELENGHGEHIPRVHTVIVKPAEQLSVLFTADVLGPWAFHCHVLYHMEVGMFRVFQITAGPTAHRS